jgi:hypothetical protein
MRRWTAAFLAAALLAPSAAGSFVLLGGEWQGKDAPLHVGRVEDDELREAIVDAAHDWEAASDFDFALIFADDEGACDRDVFGVGPLKNGVEFAFTDCDAGDLGSDTLAVTMIAEPDDAGHFVVMGMVFNREIDWAVYDGPWDASEPDVRRVALHELGHWLGLGHEGSVPAIMRGIVGDLDRLQPDDVAGARFLYGPTGPAPPPDRDPLTPEQVCRRAELRAAGALCRAELRCEAKRAGRPQKDPAGAARDACLEEAAARFDAAFESALAGGGCVWTGPAAAARATLDPLAELTAGLLTGADETSRPDAKLRQALLRRAASACADGFAAETRFVKHGEDGRRAKQRGSASDGFVRRAGRAIARAAESGVVHAGTTPAEAAVSLGALVDGFAAAAAGD